ncbi:hypothetical protein GCM10008090_25380 [Arenicella chitinivorans]|uniref:Uncharacterized protein n=1 Tax=Arenicella chitinivorans TaxID=1329800 RepID=A0A918RXA1_9GAMM|nr:hypothetical protein GCM10008090_25380 [Arenicella chitinivorans]
MTLVAEIYRWPFRKKSNNDLYLYKIQFKCVLLKHNKVSRFTIENADFAAVSVTDPLSPLTYTEYKPVAE